MATQTNPLTVNLTASYYSASNRTGPSLDGFWACGIPHQADDVQLITLTGDSTEDVLRQQEEVHRAAYDIQAYTSLLFVLCIPVQTRTFSDLAVSLLCPVSFSIANSCNNAVISIIASLAVFIILDFPTMPIRIITLIPRAIKQAIDDAEVGTHVKSHLGGHPFSSRPGKDDTVYTQDNINWNRGKLVIERMRYKEGRWMSSPPQVYFLGY